MDKMTIWKYGNAWEKFPIQEGEIWGIPENNSKVAVHNIFNPLPIFMLEADLIFVDPPWNLGNLNSFYTKAGRTDYLDEFDVFASMLFRRISEIAPHTCYIEIGRQNVADFRRRMEALYPFVQQWDVVYYRKNPCHIIRGSHVRFSDYDFAGMDEAKCIEKVAGIEQYGCIGDLCMGRGLVGLAAYAVGRRFVGTELHPRRLACLLDGLAKRGANVGRINEN